MAQTNKSRVDQALARAHHAIYIAFVEADTLRSDGVSDDLWAILRELERIHTALLCR
jgi:hypothetical protein